MADKYKNLFDEAHRRGEQVALALIKDINDVKAETAKVIIECEDLNLITKKQLQTIKGVKRAYKTLFENLHKKEQDINAAIGILMFFKQKLEGGQVSERDLAEFTKKIRKMKKNLDSEDIRIDVGVICGDLHKLVKAKFSAGAKVKTDLITIQEDLNKIITRLGVL